MAFTGGKRKILLSKLHLKRREKYNVQGEGTLSDKNVYFWRFYQGEIFLIMNL